jgi:hypothetical protein
MELENRATTELYYVKGRGGDYFILYLLRERM